MATIRKVSGKYYARFYERGRDPKRKTWPLRTSRQDVARKRCNKLEEAFREGTFDPWKGGYLKENINLSGAIEQFLQEKGKTVRETTLDDYQSKLEHWERDHTPTGLMCRDVAPAHLRNYVYDPDVSNRTKRSRYGVLRTFLLWCDEQGYLDESPLDEIKKPKKEKKQPAYFKPEQIEHILQAITTHRETQRGKPGPNPDDEWLAAMIRVGVCTGLRRAELINLRWHDVDLDEGFIAVRNREDGSFKAKSGNERTVPLRGDGLEHLREMHEARTDDLDGPVFTDKNDNPIKPDRVSKRFKFFVRKAGLKNADRLHFHSLRHTTGSWLAMRGVPMPVISKILGHSSTDVTEVYSHVSQDVTVQAMEEVFGSA